MFTERKAAQVAAYLLDKMGGSMPHMKLVKMMYLADRKSYEVYGTSITEDMAVSMPYGLALSKTLNFINGEVRNSQEWNEMISAKANHVVGLCRPVSKRDFGDLSEASTGILDDTVDEYGRMDQWELSDYTHTLPEWTNPNGSSLPVSPKAILEAVGKSPNVVKILLEYMDEGAEIDAALARI